MSDGVVTVRFAQPDEAADVFALLSPMHAENALPQAPLDARKAFAYIQSIVASAGKLGVVIVAEKDDRLIGAIVAAFMEASWFSSAWILSEQTFYIAPKHRTFGTALRMLRFFDDFGKRIGVPVRTGVMVKGDIERKAKLFGRVFKLAGYLFTGGAPGPAVGAERQ